jgi:hypothetical protein
MTAALFASIEKYVVPESIWRPILRWFFGIVLVLVGTLAGLFFMHGWDALGQGLPREGEYPVLMACIVVSGILSPLLLRLGLGQLSRGGAIVLRKDRRAPLLYLRSFAADARVVERGALARLFLLPGRYETSERSLAKAVADLGPLVAIGKPGEMLRPFGAARLYVDHDNWQRVVAELVAASRLVVLRLGRTEGFWWELQYVVANCDPRKVVVYLPRNERRALYRSLCERAADLLPQPLPEHLGKALFLGFGPGWQPQLLGDLGPSFAAWFRWLMTGSPAPGVREALNPALFQVGLNFRRMPLTFGEWLLIPLAVIFVLSLLMKVLYLMYLLARESAIQERLKQAP